MITILHNIINMMQVLDHLSVSPTLKPQPNADSPAYLSDSLSNASVESNSSGQQDSLQNSKGPKSQNIKAKSSLCKNFMERGCCPYGAKCQFAHGLGQLRFNNSEQNLYKTRQCNAFVKNAVCMYGNRCNFLHLIEQQQATYHHIVGYKEILNSWSLEKQSKLLKILSDNNKGQNKSYQH